MLQDPYIQQLSGGNGPEFRFSGSAGLEKAWLWPLPETPDWHVKRNIHLGDMLIAHFRAITRGFVPFSLDWSTEQTCSLAGNEEVALKYMRKASAYTKLYRALTHWPSF